MRRVVHLLILPLGLAAIAGCATRVRSHVPLSGKDKPVPVTRARAVTPPPPPPLVDGAPVDEPPDLEGPPRALAPAALRPAREVEGPPVSLAIRQVPEMEQEGPPRPEAPPVSRPLPPAPIMELKLAQFDMPEDPIGWDEGEGELASVDAALHFEWRRPKNTRFNVRLAAGDPGVFALRMSARSWVDKNAARTSLTIGASVAGVSFDFQLPDIRTRPVSVNGERGVELTVPIIEGRF